MGIQTDPVEIKIKRAVGRPRTTPLGPQLKSNPVGRPARPTNFIRSTNTTTRRDITTRNFANSKIQNFKKEKKEK